MTREPIVVASGDVDIFLRPADPAATTGWPVLVEAPSPSEAIDLARRILPDILFLALPPDADALDVCRDVRQQRELDAVPLMIAVPGPAHEPDLLDAGAQVVIGSAAGRRAVLAQLLAVARLALAARVTYERAVAAAHARTAHDFGNFIHAVRMGVSLARQADPGSIVLSILDEMDAGAAEAEALARRLRAPGAGVAGPADIAQAVREIAAGLGAGVAVEVSGLDHGTLVPAAVPEVHRLLYHLVSHVRGARDGVPVTIAARSMDGQVRVTVQAGAGAVAVVWPADPAAGREEEQGAC